MHLHLTGGVYDFYAFPPFSLVSRVRKKDRVRRRRGDLCITRFANPTVVPQSQTDDANSTACSRAKQEPLHLTDQTRCSTSITFKASTSSVPLISTKLAGYHLSQSAQHLLLSSWRPGTLKQLPSLAMGKLLLSKQYRSVTTYGTKCY